MLALEPGRAIAGSRPWSVQTPVLAMLAPARDLKTGGELHACRRAQSAVLELVALRSGVQVAKFELNRTAHIEALGAKELCKLAVTRDLYLPISFVEALGRATIARCQLELGFNVLVALLAAEPDRLHKCRPIESFEVKLRYLAAAPRSRLLKHEWCHRLRHLVADAEKLNQQYLDAAMSSVYSRGAGFLEEMMRPLAHKMKVIPGSLGMTPAKIDRLAVEFRDLACTSADLSTSLLKAAERLEILPVRD